MESGVKRPEGFVETVRRNIQEFFANMHITSSDVIKVVSCFGIGFICGLILKRYFKYIVAFVLFSILFLSTLHYFEFIIVNKEKFKMVLGLQGTETFDSVMTVFIAFIKLHIVEVGSGVLGCLLGFKVG